MESKENIFNIPVTVVERHAQGQSYWVIDENGKRKLRNQVDLKKIPVDTAPIFVEDTIP